MSSVNRLDFVLERQCIVCDGEAELLDIVHTEEPHQNKGSFSSTTSLPFIYPFVFFLALIPLHP
jgi:hypothetical protein